MRSRALWMLGASLAASQLMVGCAVQSPPVNVKEAAPSVAAQRQAQAAMVATTTTAQPTLKRKIALGRITNETNYGRSLLRDSSGDPLGKQVTDLLSKSLTQSGGFIVLERPDISKVQAESSLTGGKTNLIGTDALIVGSLTEFGRKTIGESGFVSSSKRQVAFAKVDLRVVDTTTGQVVFATSGAGETSTETASTFGFGSQAAYDGTLNDAAIRQAVSEAVNKLSTEMQARPWQTYILANAGQGYVISGGKAQGLRPGMTLTVLTAGEKVRSPQTGFDITIPGHEVAQMRVDSTFGDSETNEGSMASVISGSLQGYGFQQLVVRSKEAL